MRFSCQLKPFSTKLLIFRNIDIVIGASKEIQRKLSHSIPFLFDDLTWCVKKADLRPPWLSVLSSIATPTVWLVFVPLVFIFGFALFLMLKYYHHPENYFYCLGMSLLIVIATPLPYYPTHGLARIHFGMHLIYGLVAVIFINCFLVSMLMRPRYGHQITTTEEILHFDYKILINSEFIVLPDLGNDEVNLF